MKRGGPLKRTTPLRPTRLLVRDMRALLKVNKQPTRRAKLRVAGHSDTAQTKREIQRLLREIVILRDKGCLLRNVRLCGGDVGIPGVVLQADHLITRSNSATYADSRLVVCVCVRCHAWKSKGSNQRKAQYDELVRALLSADRVGLWDACERDSWRPHPMRTSDWKLAEVALTAELVALKGALLAAD